MPGFNLPDRLRHGANDDFGPRSSESSKHVVSIFAGVPQRDGDATTKGLTPKTANDAVRKPDASGKSVNALEVRVMADKLDFAVNGTVVHSLPRSGLGAKTDGIYGIRVNHQLDVTIDGFGAKRRK